ncbi:MAG: flagellar motor switch phosphatase FliY [Lachnospiraceae bacterium]|jgi:flagellar motor switch protein FliN/FliY|nr:flagellar motor switch phosphatase FliY [Lachnospiraceae bacterium]
MDGDGMLSQEEINALFSGMDDDEKTETEANDVNQNTEAAVSHPERVGDVLTDIEKDAIGEISNISMGTAATTLNTLVGQAVNITTPRVTYGVWEDLTNDFKDRPCVALQLGYKEGLNGQNILILKERDVMVITDLMMGGDGTNTSGELNELHLSAISEAMNQMMGSSSTSLSSMINKKIDILPPKAKVIDFNDNFSLDDTDSFVLGEFVRVSFKMTIGDLVDSEIMQLYPIDFAKKLYDMFTGMGEGQQEEKHEPKKEDTQNMQSPPQQEAPFMQGQQAQQGQPQMMPGYGMPPYAQPQMMPGYGMPSYAQPQMMPGYGMPPYAQPMMDQQGVNVQPAQFQAFNNNISPVQQKENIDLILDVPLQVTVELGKTRRSIKEILEFSPGTVIELDKIAGEPVDVLVNGKYVAKGEVVVLEESFAVRITEIIK